MANIKSQIKRNRQNEKRRARNRTTRSELSTRTKAAIAAAEAGSDDHAHLESQAFTRRQQGKRTG